MFFFFFNIVLTWKIVVLAKASVLYIYIDYSKKLPNVFISPTNGIRAKVMEQTKKPKTNSGIRAWLI